MLNRENIKFGLTTKRLTFCSMAIVLSLICSYIKIIHMPTGGSVTLFSMLFICLIGNWYGFKVGIVSGMALGLLRFIIDPLAFSLPQVILDYPLAFGALGISGFFNKSKHGLLIGYMAGVFGRYFFAVLSGVVFFSSYAPKDLNPLIYSMVYNGLYIGVEAVMTVILINIPPIIKALNRIKAKALS